MIEANVPLPQDDEKAKASSIDITMQQIHRNDPLSFFLKEKLHINNLLIFILLTLITLACFYALYSLPGVSAKLVNQAIFALLETFTACLFFTAYIWLPDAVCFLFNSLRDNEVLDTSNPKKYQASYESFGKSFLFWMNRRIWPIGTLIFILLYLLNRYLAGGPPFINHVPFWLQIVTAILDGLIAYCAFMSVIRFIISIIFVNYLFHSFPIHVNPLHPDGCGGLGVMHRVLWITVAIVLGTTLTFYETVMISAANNIPSSNLDAAVLIVAYLILAPALIMGWLAFPHHLMLKDRQATLLPLVNEFQQIATKSVLVTEEETPKILADTDRLSAIKRRYELLDETFPTWPVEVRQMRNIIAALGISALLQLLPYISSVIQNIGGLLLK